MGHKNYDNNFYEMPILKSSKSQTFGAEVFNISNYLNLRLNWHLGLIIEIIVKPFAKFISIHNL